MMEMIEYVLFWMVLSGGNIAVDSQTFASKQACEYTAYAIKKNFQSFSVDIKTACVPKK